MIPVAAIGSPSVPRLEAPAPRPRRLPSNARPAHEEER